MTASELAIDDMLSGAVLPPDLARVRETYARFKYATVEFAEACLAAQRNGRTIRQIADAAGCGKSTVGYVIQALVQSLDTGEPFSEVFTAITNTSRKPKPEPETKSPAPQPEIPLRDEPDEWPDPPSGPSGSAGHSEKLSRLREMADEAERADPYVPIRELMDLRDALRRVIPKMGALRNAGQAVGAGALTSEIAILCKGLEELL